MFADLSELTHNRPAGEDLSAGRPVHSAREYFHAYLKSLDVERAGLPEMFQDSLQRVLSHYGVAGLDRTPELEEAVFRIFLAQQRAWTDVAVVSALLRQWLTEAPPAESLREEAGLALEHLVAATQVRYPAVSDLARGVVFRWFAQPVLRRARAKVYAEVRQSLRYLDRNPDSPDRAERIAAMVAASEPLVRLLGQRIGRPGTDQAPLLEVLTRRYYGNKGLSDIRSRDVAGCPFVIAEHVRQARVVTTAVDFAQLADAVRAVRELASDAPSDANVVADLYVRWAGQPEADAMAARLGEVIAAQPLPERVGRITTTVAGGGGAVMHHHFTFRRGATGTGAAGTE